MSRIKKLSIVITVLFVVWFAISTLLAHQNINDENRILSLNLNNNILQVEIVSTQEKLEKGLGGRKDLCEDCGMLFEFKVAGKYSFWMKDMFFPLDILWISGNRIVYIGKKIQPDFKGVMIPAENADFVLELNGGKVDEFGIKVGDIVTF